MTVLTGATEAARSADSYWDWRRTKAHETFRAARDLLLDLREDHDGAVERFRWPRPAHFNWALEWFDVVAAGNDAPAIEFLDAQGGATPVSYAELSARSDALAVRLTGRGVARGERVMVVLGQRAELWETILACLKIGAVVIPTYTSLTRAEAQDRLTRGRVEHLVCESRAAGLFDDARVRTRTVVGAPVEGWADYADGAPAGTPFLPAGPTPADDVAFCYFTSGTTSAPKLVAHTHASYPIGHLSSLFWNGLVPGDRHLNVSAPGWAKHSWSSLFVPWNAEATIVALPDGPTPFAELPGLLAAHRVSTFCAPPSTWLRIGGLLESARPRLREAMSAGEPLDPALGAAVQEAWGVRVRDGYGQTETTGLIGTTPGMAQRPGWLGRPLPGYRITLRDPATGAEQDAGEICVELDDAPAGMMTGYLRDDVCSREAFEAGFYRTGDMGERDAEGYVRVFGRRDDVFKSFDHRISPYELERVLRRHPAVAEAAVVRRTHPVGGFVPHAVVEVADGWTAGAELADALLAHTAEQVTEVLRVRSVEFTDQLPRTVSGKVRRSALKPPPAG